MTCQSVAQPSSAEYWHIGAMTMRLRSSSPATRNGVNRRAWLMPQRIVIRAGRGRGRDTIGAHMRIKLIVNPASGGESALDHLPAINARLRAGR